MATGITREMRSIPQVLMRTLALTRPTTRRLCSANFPKQRDRSTNGRYIRDRERCSDRAVREAATQSGRRHNSVGQISQRVPPGFFARWLRAARFPFPFILFSLRSASMHNRRQCRITMYGGQIAPCVSDGHFPLHCPG
jgi:hypothetical protein